MERVWKKRLLAALLTGTLVLPGILGENPAEAAEPAGNPSRQQEKLPFQAGPGIAVAQTEAGQVQGYVRQGIYTYHGIPYAEAPERFVRARRVKPWQGVRMAVEYGPIATQEKSAFPNTNWEQPGREFSMSDSCQNLNIWTPGLRDGKKRPVMVWLHGGGFSNGSSAESPAYDGDSLSRRGDVVVVSVNHRLNVLGHLDLSAYGEKYRESANVGILDLVDALQWIRRNIREFGGDSQNVTLFGESGGGAKVLALMTAPEARGLFQRGIVESGAVESMGPYFMEPRQSRRIAELILEQFGLGPDQAAELETMPYDRLAQASDKALALAGKEFDVPLWDGSGYGLSWEPVIDGTVLLTHPVTETGFAEAGRDVPMIIGSNRTEWTNFRLLTDLLHSQSDNIQTWSREKTEQALDSRYGDKKETVVRAFLKAYPDKSRGDALYVDTMIRQPILKIARHKAAQGGAPVYNYLFSWDSPVMGGVYMSYHTAEIPFVFHNIDTLENRIGGGSDARRLQDRMSDAWLAFARTGKPAVPGAPEWKPFTDREGAVMVFDKKIRLEQAPDRELLELLDSGYQDSLKKH